jgi:hypothetical protein
MLLFMYCYHFSQVPIIHIVIHRKCDVYCNQFFCFLWIFFYLIAALTHVKWKLLRNIPVCSWASTWISTFIDDLSKDNRQSNSKDFYFLFLHSFFVFNDVYGFPETLCHFHLYWWLSRENIGQRLKVFCIDFKVYFVSTSTFSCTHFRSASINNAEQLHSYFIGYCYRSAVVINWGVSRVITICGVLSI